MFRITFLGILCCIANLEVLSQITIKVVAVDSSEIVTESPEVIPQVLDSAGFNLILCGSTERARPRLEQMYFDNVAFIVKRYSKLKTFEIIVQKNSSHEKRIKWYKGHQELKHLRKHRWIYEGDSVVQTFELLDSLTKNYLPKAIISRNRTTGTFNNLKEYRSTFSPYITNFYLEENKVSDNFLLNIELRGGQKLQIPVGILTEGTNAKRIQKLYMNFYDSYRKDLNERNEEWKRTDEEYREYLKEFESDGWTKTEVNNPSNFRTPFGMMRGRRLSNKLPVIADYLTTDNKPIKPLTIYVVDFTLNSVYVFTDIRSVYYFNSNNTAIMVEDQDKNLGILNTSEFKETEVRKEKRQLRFDMKFSADLLLNDLLALAE